MDLDPRHPTLRLAPGQRHDLPDARRADVLDLAREVRVASESPIVTALLEAVDASLLVLNTRGQVVALNTRSAAGSAVAGLRSGEALGCINARAPGGCGTTTACETCGALGA